MAEGGYPSKEISKIEPNFAAPAQKIVYTDPKTGIYTCIENATNVQFNGKMVVYMGSHGYKSKKIKPKKPITSSEDPVTTDQRLSIKDQLGKDWKNLGRHLEFQESWLEQMHCQHKDDLGELNYQILYRWQQECPDKATQKNLAKIFVGMHRGDLADLLAE